MAGATMMFRLVVQAVAWFLFTAPLLFVAAGTDRWTAGWYYLILTGLCGLGSGLWLARFDPELLHQRLASPVQSGQTAFDKVILAIFLLLYHAWLAFMALDAVRFAWSHVPYRLRAAGVMLMLIGNGVVFLACRANTFAAPVVKIQPERGQRVVDAGPYAVVRHPIYAGNLILMTGAPLLLGSWGGLAATIVLFAPLLALRAFLEERALSQGLEGYPRYASRVRYRLIPGIW
jgi:protein-S-isoprenylcysteine O-methyltransferase Ste14